MDNVKKGTLHGVSVGPGDPELMTLKAVRCIEQCPVLAAPQTAAGRMLALTDYDPAQDAGYFATILVKE